MSSANIRFWFDPVCPFAWLTSTWVRSVARQLDHRVEWRLISLRLLNAEVDYDARFSPGYERGHTAGLRLLRVAARARAEHGADIVGPLYEALGRRLWEEGPADAATRIDDGTLVEPALAEVGLPAELRDAADDVSLDDGVGEDTELALGFSGRDVGTPILQVRPPGGPAFFGPVISRTPDDAEALRLWEHVVALADLPGFAELKRSLRERPQLPAFGVPRGDVGEVEDWHGGSRRTDGARA